MSANNENPTDQPNVQQLQKTVLDLNTDCLLHIFQHLNVEEMAIASDACQRFRDVASEAFKYSWKFYVIILSDATQGSKLAATAILRNFGDQLQKVFMDFSGEWNENILRMVTEKCNGGQLTEVFVSQKNFELKNIDRFKNKFTNLEDLGLDNTHNDIDLDIRFPSSLEKLILCGRGCKKRQVVRIVSLCPQLKSLELAYETGIGQVRSVLEAVDEHLPQLEQLELARISGDVTETAYQPNLFKNLKRLKFHEFTRGHLMQHLSISNGNVEQLEFEYVPWYDSGLTKFICNYKEVKKLSIHEIICPMDYRVLLKLNDHLKKLVEFEISSFSVNINHQAIIQFVLNSKQLVTLTIIDRKIENTSEFKKDLERKLDTTKWAVDCYLRSKKLIIRRL